MSDSVSFGLGNCPECGDEMLCIENNTMMFEEVCANEACNFFHLVMPNPQMKERGRGIRNASIA